MAQESEVVRKLKRDLELATEELKAIKAGSAVDLNRSAHKAIAAENSRVRDGLKSRTRKSGKGADQVAYYFAPEASYRLGRYSPPGSTIALPIDEDPSITWLPISEKGLVLQADVDEPMPHQPGDENALADQDPDTMSAMSARRAADIPVA